MRTGKQPLGFETHKRPGGGQSEVAEKWAGGKGDSSIQLFQKCVSRGEERKCRCRKGSGLGRVLFCLFI